MILQFVAALLGTLLIGSLMLFADKSFELHYDRNGLIWSVAAGLAVGLAEMLSEFVINLAASPLNTLLVVVALYIVLGFFIETLSLMVITVPIVAPILVNLGYDPIWFGILLILLIEMALITPPVGLNLYVVQGVRQSGSISDVMIGAAPFVCMIAVMIVLLIIFPEIALYCTQFVN